MSGGPAGRERTGATLTDAGAGPGEVLVVTSSCRAGSSTSRLGTLVADALRERGRQVDVVHVGDLGLPWCTGASEQGEVPIVRRWRERAQRAAAHVWVSPEWHGSMAGTLKNALDLLAVRDMHWKLVALVAQAGGAMGATNALGHMRVVAQNLGAWVLPVQLSAAASELGPPPDRHIEERLARLTAEFDEGLARLERVM